MEQGTKRLAACGVVIALLSETWIAHCSAMPTPGAAAVVCVVGHEHVPTERDAFVWRGLVVAGTTSPGWGLFTWHPPLPR
jgi:peptidoglycan/LPS O-acetylase OafA/YrhL